MSRCQTGTFSTQRAVKVLWLVWLWSPPLVKNVPVCQCNTWEPRPPHSKLLHLLQLHIWPTFLRYGQGFQMDNCRCQKCSKMDNGKCQKCSPMSSQMSKILPDVIPNGKNVLTCHMTNKNIFDISDAPPGRLWIRTLPPGGWSWFWKFFAWARGRILMWVMQVLAFWGPPL